MPVHLSSRARTTLAAGWLASLALIGTPPRADAQGAPGAAAQAGPVRRLSLDDAVATALEQNLDLQVQRINPQLQDLTVAQVRTAYAPNFTTEVNLLGQTQPPSSFLSGGTTRITNNRSTFDFGVAAQAPWRGGSYQAGWNNGRTTSNNIFTNFNPQLTTSMSLSYTQPLLRNFTIDGTRQQLLVSRKNREISDVQLRGSIANTVRSVKNAYYDLMYAISNLAVQRQSLELAEQSLKDNRARVEIGTMAPIDIVQAEAEVATREESVILAEAQIERAQDALRTLVYSPSTPEFWNARIEPTETITFTATPVNPEAAVTRALKERTDLDTARKNLENADVNVRYYRNQTLPDVNATLNYSAQAVGGTQLVRGAGFPGPVTGTIDKSYGSTLGEAFTGDFPAWTFAVQIGYPVGRSNAEAQLARTRLQQQQQQKQLDSLEMQITAQVREYARQVQTNAKRVEATRASRVLAERRLEAEEKKFQAGMTSSFFVLQAQRDLNVARNNELSALVEYAKSAVNYEAVQQAPLGGGGATASAATASTQTPQQQ
jgi:outer membrane protein TolC